MVKKVRRKAAFTLVEVLVAALFLGILATTAVPSYIEKAANARRKAADENARILSASIQNVGTEEGRYPSDPLEDAAVHADLNGPIPDNPCSVLRGAEGYAFSSPSPTEASLTAKADLCAGFTPKTYMMRL